ncbi:hypothetical protein EDF56_103470 [Novosphingobium sp. PhB165]|uniref:hypothetical protein n=1 Tax=Novosphingobium sp. PhB165 TaxID=2485105 RepID=UPI00104984F9|nr:hypothetical protein [Novosphingobium sp. PhB165]TCM19825.1 hypothetical protein EDF56_103470 [Novosphingobium sp. PhB165]
MNELVPISHWSALLLGLFTLFTSLGELRRPGHWQKLLDEITRSPALQLLTAMIEFPVGVAIWFLNPWPSPDWLSRVMNVIGVLMGAEALLILAIPDRYLGVWIRRFSPLSRVWAWISAAFGLALIAAALINR